MTAEEHIVAWIESSQPHYRRLLKLSVPGNFLSDLGRAQKSDIGKRLHKMRGVLCLENQEQMQARQASENVP